MEYTLTEHARDVLKKREIPVDWMERALTAPEVIESDRVDPDLEHRLRRIPEAANRVLHLIVNRRRSPLRVVTVFFDRRRVIP